MQKQLNYLFLVILCFIYNQSEGADSTKQVKKWTYSGYLETFYSYYFDNSKNTQIPSYYYNFNKHNEFEINLGLIKLSYNESRIRSNLGLMIGTYPEANLSAEPKALRNIFEANLGYKLNKNNLWLDVGVFSSHIGFESAIGKDCWTLTRSILADNSPYYEAGAKLSYTSANDKLFLSALILNGWQKIIATPNYKLPAIGTQVYYKFNDKTSLNWSTYLGSEPTDNLGEWRFFNNFYTKLLVGKKLGLIAGFDIGVQQNRDSIGLLSKNNSIWYSPVIQTKYEINSKASLALRTEFYSDKSKVILQSNSLNTQIFSTSLNIDYLPVKTTLLRLEGKILQPYAYKKYMATNYLLTAAMAISF